MSKSHSKKRILILPGGGATGVTTVRVLEALEEKLGRPISQLFDEIWAASVGSMMAAYLTEPQCGNSVRSAQRVGQLIRESFANPWSAWHCLDRFQSEINPDLRLNDTVIPLKILTAKVKNFPKRESPVFGRFETQAIGLCSETSGDLSLVQAVRASCAVYPLMPAQRLRLDPLDLDGIVCIDSGCRVCTEPTLDPTRVFLEDLDEQPSILETPIQLFFISNGWARWSIQTQKSSVEVLNFDLDLSPRFQSLGSSQLGKRICSNLIGMGFTSVSALDSWAKDAIYGKNWGVFQKMVRELRPVS